VKNVTVRGDRDVLAELEEDSALAPISMIIARGNENGFERLEARSRDRLTLGKEGVQDGKLSGVMASDDRPIDARSEGPRRVRSDTGDVDLGPVAGTQATLEHTYG
jgi:hypothetical protein